MNEGRDKMNKLWESGPKENIGWKLIKQGVNMVHQKTYYKLWPRESLLVLGINLAQQFLAAITKTENK